MTVTVNMLPEGKEIMVTIMGITKNIQDFTMGDSNEITRTTCESSKGFFADLAFCHQGVFFYNGHEEELAFCRILTGRMQTAEDIANRIAVRFYVIEKWKLICDSEDDRLNRTVHFEL